MKLIKVNNYSAPYPRYVILDHKKKQNKAGLVISSLIGGMIGLLGLWAISYMACVGTYHSSACKDNIATKLIIQIIK